MIRQRRPTRKLVVLRMNEASTDDAHAKMSKSLQRSFGTAYRVVLLPESINTIEIAEATNV